MENRTILTDVTVRRTYRSNVRVTIKEQGYTLTRAQKVYSHLKRVLDIFLALIAVIILSPVLIACAIAIKCDSKGPAIFKQNRVGKGGKSFRVYKFRTMSTDAPANVATSEMKNANCYITKVGNFLRKTSLDELPQLFNVLKGDMSLDPVRWWKRKLKSMKNGCSTECMPCARASPALPRSADVIW